MARLGLDPEQLNGVGKQLRTDATTIRSISSKLDAQLRTAWWEGPDARKFLAEWESAYKVQLTKIAAALEAAAQAVANNVSQQTQASSS